MAGLEHFTRADVLAVLLGVGLFGLLLAVSGYSLAWLCDVLKFRQRGLPARLCIGVSMGIALGPSVCFLLGRTGSFVPVWTFYGGLVCLFPFIIRIKGAHALPGRGMWLVLAAWLCLAVASLVDWQIGSRLYFSVTAFDHNLRTALVSAIGRDGLPPSTPFFHPGHSFPLRYHYLWLLLCSLVDQLGGRWVDPRQAMIAGIVWAGWALLAITALYLRHFTALGRTDIHRRVMIAAGLLTVTGLDLLPTLFVATVSTLSGQPGFAPSVDWWNNYVNGWVDSALWVPHYVVSVIACLFAFLLLWEERGGGWVAMRRTMIPAGLALASAAGCGIYTALVFAVFLGIWLGGMILRGMRRETIVVGAAGLIAMLAAAPYLADLLRSSGGTGRGPVAVIVPTVRSFSWVEAVLESLDVKQNWLFAVVNLVLLPLNYALEFGFFYVLAAWQGKRMWARRHSLTATEAAGALLAGTSLLICTFFRSNVIANNDLGWRGMLFAQFIFLLWGVEFLATQPVPRSWRTLLALGVLGSVYDAAALRIFPVLHDARKVQEVRWLSVDGHLGERTYDARQAYEWLEERVPAQAILQHNPQVVFDDFYNGLYGHHQNVLSVRGCNPPFGGDPAACPPAEAAVSGLFRRSNGVSVDAVCERYGVSVLVVKDLDPVWQDRGSWVWSREPLFANRRVRLYGCPSLRLTAQVPQGQQSPQGDR